MMFDNRLPDDQLAALQPGDPVVVELSKGWNRGEISAGKVAKLTPKQIVVRYAGANATVESRFRRDNGRYIGDGSGQLLDPAHPTTVRVFAAKQQQARRQTIDLLAMRWKRDPDNLDHLRQLQVAISEYLDAEA